MRRRSPARAQHEAEQQRRENICAAIACDVLGGGARWRRRDERGGPQGLHDFDLEFPDGHVEALEVCAYTDPAAEQQRAALEDTRRLESSLLTRSWMASIPDRGMDLRTARSGELLVSVERHLSVLEAHGEDDFYRGNGWMASVEMGVDHPLVRALWALDELGVLHAHSGEVSQPPFLELAPSTGTYIDPEAVSRAVEDRAGERGNLEKLRAASGATARHIFIPVYFGAFHEHAAVGHIEDETMSPVLPPEVTRAWVIGGASGVLYVKPPDGWQKADFNRDAVDQPEMYESARDAT